MILKKKITILIVFFLVLSILFIFFVISPLFLGIKKNSQEFLFQKQKLMALEEKIENLEKFKIIFPEVSPNLEKIENLFIDREVPVDFIGFLEKTSQDSGIYLKISVGPPLEIEKDPWPSISFQLSLIGSFSNFAKFLEKLESALYLIEIQNLNITRLSENELKSKELEMYSLGEIRANFSIKVYTR